MDDRRAILRDYYDAASSHYTARSSKGLMGWMRRRELALTLDMIPRQGGGTALDAGCGPGYYSQVLKKRGFDVAAVDISPEMVEMVRGLGFPAFEMDLEHERPSPELGAPFDFLFCAGVAEFAEDRQRFFGALRRMLRADGEMLIVAPHAGLFAFFYRKYLESRGIPAQVYTRKSISKDLQQAGFEITDVRVAWPICLAVRAKAV